jgi:hypothetical protein
MSNRDVRPIQVGLRLLALVVTLSHYDRPGSKQERAVRGRRQQTRAAESSLGFDVHALAAKALTQSPLLRDRISAFYRDCQSSDRRGR